MLSLPWRHSGKHIRRYGELLPATRIHPDIAKQAVAVGAKVLWMQMGITSAEAVEIASDAGLKVVQSLCLMKEYNRLLG